MASIDDSDVPETGAVFTFGRSRFADNLTNKFWIRNDRIIHIATGDEHSVVVTERGRLYSFGTNDWGQLGLGHSKAVNKPSFIKALKPNKMVLAACGRTHTIVASEAGKVFSFGSGGDGQLGHGNTEDQNLPKQIEGLPIGKVKILSCGVYHSAVLFESGDLYTWGSGSDGQSGHEEEETLEPKKLKFESKVSWVACGYYHTAVVTDNGKLYTFGENEFGKLGLTGSQVNDTSRPQPVATEEGSFIAVACGAGHTVALTDEGKVFSFGDGSRGQLGQGTRTQEMSVPKIIEQLSHLKIEAVSCGDCHSAVITEKGKLYTFGDGRHGKLAQGEECFSNLFRPQLVSRFAEFRVQSVSCGGCHTLVTAIRKEHDSNDEEDEADGVLNASMTSSYSYASMNEANATMRLQGLSNTVPMISPRDKRRKKEAENLANSFSGSFKHITKNDLPALGMTLDRNRLPQIPKIKEPTRKESESSQVSNKMTKESKSNIEEKSKDMNVEKRNMKNSQKDKDEIEFKKKLEKELGDDMKNDKQKNIESKKVEIKEDGKERLDSDDKGKVLDKGKDENEEEDDEESEEDDEEEEEEETESEDDDEAEAKSEGQVSEIKKHSNSTKEDAIDKGLTVQKTVVRDELGKKKEEDEDEEEEEESDEEEETDEDGEEDDDDDEEDDEEEDDDDDDDDEEDEDEEEDNVDKAKLKTENNKDSIEKEAVIEVNSNATDDKSDTKDVKNDKIEDKKDKKNAKDDKKKGKGDKKKNKNDKSDKIDDKENINKGDSKNEDGSSENNNNNMEDAEKIETNEKEKLITEDDKKGKSKFGGLFGRKKQPATVNQESKDEVDGEAGKTAPKKTGKSGVCSIL